MSHSYVDHEAVSGDLSDFYPGHPSSSGRPRRVSGWTMSRRSVDRPSARVEAVDEVRARVRTRMYGRCPCDRVPPARYHRPHGELLAATWGPGGQGWEPLRAVVDRGRHARRPGVAERTDLRGA